MTRDELQRMAAQCWVDMSLGNIARPGAASATKHLLEWFTKVHDAATEEAAKAVEDTEVEYITWAGQLIDDGTKTLSSATKAIRALKTAK